MKTKEFYIKTINMKMYLGLYFAGFVFLYGVTRILCGFDEIMINVLLEMVIASFLIVVLQILLLPDTIDLTKRLFISRSIFWLFLSTFIIFIISYWGGWFTDMPNYYMYGFIICAGIAFLMMLSGLRFLQEADTVRLNHALQDYQKEGR